MTINTVDVSRAIDTDLVPVGARLTIAGNATIYIVTGRTPTSNSPTIAIDISPLLAANVIANNSVSQITFAPQELAIKIGQGNLTYSEHLDFKYTLDRGNLDTVREGDEKPVDVKTDFLYEFVTTGTNEVITPVDALKQSGGAAEWVSSASDQCEPYAVDVQITQVPPCLNVEDEVTLLPVFRYETLEFNLKDGMIAVTGKCNVVEATVTRV